MNIIERTVEKSIKEFAEGKQINLDAEAARLDLAKIIIADLTSLATKLDGAVESVYDG